MRFQHSLAVSDPDQEFTPSRHEVWTALVRRVHQPDAFVAHLTSFRIIAQEPHRVERELCFGQATVRDVVSVDADAGSLRFEVAKTEQHAGGVLTIAIEESDGLINLRFSYGTTLDSGGDSSEIDAVDYVKAAYAASDRDTVAVVRRSLGYDQQ